MLALTLTAAFGLELAVLFAFGLWGFQIGQSVLTQTLFGVGTPLLTAVFWGAFLSPKAAVKSPLLQLALKLVVFTLATAAFLATGHFVSGIVFSVLAVILTLRLHALRVSSEQLHSFQHP